MSERTQLDLIKGLDKSKLPALMPPPGHPIGVFHAYPERERSMLGAAITLIVVSFIVMSGRLYLNAFDKARKLSWDDAFCAIGWLCSAIWTILWTIMRRYFRHAYDFPLSWYSEWYFKMIFATNFFLPAAQFFVKGAFIILFLRIFSPNKRVRMVLYALFVFSFCAYWVTLPVFSVYCVPKGGFWSLESQLNCRHANLLGPIAGSLNLFIDLALLIIPLSVVSTLKLNRRRKYQLMAIFATGMLAVTAGVVGLAYRVVSWKYGQGGKDVNYYNYYQILAAFIELFISSICSSMPAYARFSKQYLSYFTRIRIPSSLRFTPSSDKSFKKTKIPHVQTNAPVLETPNFGTALDERERFTGRGYLELGRDSSDEKYRREEMGGGVARPKPAVSKGGIRHVETDRDVEREFVVKETLYD